MIVVGDRHYARPKAGDLKLPGALSAGRSNDAESTK